MSNTIRQWIEIDPLDTLFFRGSEPMVAGQNHEVRTVFPPMPSTIVGALRTAVLTQRNMDFAGFVRCEGDGPAFAEFPLLGTAEAPGFAVAGPLIRAEVAGGMTEVFFPAPACWIQEENNTEDAITVSAAKSNLGEAAELGLTGSSPHPLLVPAPLSEAMKGLHGFWANAAAFAAMAKGSGKLAHAQSLRDVKAGSPFLLGPEMLFSREHRTGIALDLGAHRVRKGHLYAATHVRLALGVRLLVGLSEELIPTHLDADGLLQLGGEQRLVRYRLCKNKMQLPEAASNWALAVAPIDWNYFRDAGLSDRPRASGPLLRMAGWDMKRRFHKPTRAFLPMGTVVKRKEEEETIPFGFIAI